MNLQLTLTPLPAFTDNYIWMLHDGHKALVVDPGDAAVVFDALQRLSLRLETILVTHHHVDHTGGVAELREATGAAVFGPLTEVTPEPIRRLQGGDNMQALGLTFNVIDMPEHTSGHIAYYCEQLQGKTKDGAPILFCGDTLFSAGCGRLFEGTPSQMLSSLNKWSALPSSTRVCCTHEYRLSNLKFARELQINPFFRSDQAEVVHAAQQLDPTAIGAMGVFTAIRQRKNNF